VDAPTSFSCFFQIESTGDSTAKQNKIKYDYLSETGWEELEVIVNDTDELAKTGIIVYNIPSDIAFAKLQEQNAFWLRITTVEESGVFGNILSVHPQALKAERVIAEGELDATEGVEGRGADAEMNSALKAGSIKGTMEPIAGLLSVKQPFESFGGKAKENNEKHYDRVSARIKNKDRISTVSDYEKMTYLFDDGVYYATCLGNSKANLSLFVLPSYNTVSNSNALRPSIARPQLMALKNYFKQRQSPFVNLTVANFGWEIVQVVCTVATSNPGNRAGTIDRLNENISLFLSPWVQCDFEQLNIKAGLKLTDLYSMIYNDDDVTMIKQLDVYIDGVIDNNEIAITQNKSSVFVSALQHKISAE
jgi:hypothetical protein